MQGQRPYDAQTASWNYTGNLTCKQEVDGNINSAISWSESKNAFDVNDFPYLVDF